MDNKELCCQIGDAFGRFYEDNGMLCIDNGVQVSRYETPEELLKDWVCLPCK